MANWVVTDGTLWQKLSEIRRAEIRIWLRMNGINPSIVPVDATVMIVEAAHDQWEIWYEEYLANGDGTIVAADDGFDSICAYGRQVPLVIDPPMHWLIPAVPTS